MDNYSPTPVPKGQFALIQAEVRTGILQRTAGGRYHGEGECALFFHTQEAALEKARDIVRSNPELECIVADDQGQKLAWIRDEDYIKSILEEAEKTRNQKAGRWKFWKTWLRALRRTASGVTRKNR